MCIGTGDDALNREGGGQLTEIYGGLQVCSGYVVGGHCRPLQTGFIYRDNLAVEDVLGGVDSLISGQK